MAYAGDGGRGTTCWECPKVRGPPFQESARWESARWEEVPAMELARRQAGWEGARGWFWGSARGSYRLCCLDLGIARRDRLWESARRDSARSS